MVVSIGAIASPSQGVSYYERDGYYAKDDPEHRMQSAWQGRGADELGLQGPVDPATFQSVLEGEVPDGSGVRLGRVDGDGNRLHRPGRDLTFSAPKSVSLAALVGGDDRVVEAHDRAVQRTLDWIERNVAETRMRDPETGRMIRAGGQKIVAATFRHDTSRNLDPQLHTHAVLANMVRGEDDKWRTMANEALYRRQKTDRHALSQRTRAGTRRARLPDREEPCRRALRDRRRVPRDRRDPSRQDAPRSRRRSPNAGPTARRRTRAWPSARR